MSKHNLFFLFVVMYVYTASVLLGLSLGTGQGMFPLSCHVMSVTRKFRVRETIFGFLDQRQLTMGSNILDHH